jgi:hypothetical protein
MIFSLDVRRARKGDCLLLHFGTRREPGLALIDGGPRGVYQAHLRPRLEEIRAARRLGRTEPLPVDLVMVSHIDDDHIQGLLDMTGELAAATAPPLVRVLALWHNSFDQMIGSDPAPLWASLASRFGAAALRDDPPEPSALGLDADGEAVRSTLAVLASIEQGHRLRLDAEKLGFTRNPEFDEELILARRTPAALHHGLALTVAGPMPAELRALKKQHDEWLKKRGADVREALAAYVDARSPTCRASWSWLSWKESACSSRGCTRGQDPERPGGDRAHRTGRRDAREHPQGAAPRQRQQSGR